MSNNLIYFVDAPWAHAALSGNSIVYNDGGVMRSVHAKKAEIVIAKTASPEYLAMDNPLTCAAFPVLITIDETEYETAMCLKIYSSLIAITVSPTDNRARTTVLQNVKSTAGGIIRSVLSCSKCG